MRDYAQTASAHLRTERPARVEAPASQPPQPSPDVAAPPATAIIAWHGMGQQLPLETLEAVARGLAARERRVHGRPDPPIAARQVQLGSQKLWRAELELTDAAGRPHRVHVYEAYWAACTQGRVTLAETVKFLFGAGYHGVRFALLPPPVLRRYLFDRWVAFPLSPVLAVIYLGLLAAFSSLVLVNLAVSTALSVKLLTGAGDAASWPSYALLRDLTVDLGLLAIAFGASGAVLGAAHATQVSNRRTLAAPVRREWVRLVVWTLLAASLAATLVTGVLIAYHLFVHSAWGDAAWAWPAWVWDLFARWQPASWGASVAWMVVAAAIWVVALVGSAVVRWFLLEFVGDSAIYVSSHTLSRFYETRQAIADSSFKTVRAIYRFGGYGGHVLMGHSLGSVIAYDTLNRLLVEDALTGGSQKTAARTNLLLTFGSILDKTAFLFRGQAEVGGVREALAAASQPLISDPAARPRWINIYSRDDILSGALDYYDPAYGEAQAMAGVVPNPPAPVENREDASAWIPLLAHTQYWTGDLLWTTLADAVIGQPGVSEARTES